MSHLVIEHMYVFLATNGAADESISLLLKAYIRYYMSLHKNSFIDASANSVFVIFERICILIKY